MQSLKYLNAFILPCVCRCSAPELHCETKQQLVVGRLVSGIQTEGACHPLLDGLPVFLKTLGQCHRFACEKIKFVFHVSITRKLVTY
jgi:hypothetical protein